MDARPRRNSNYRLNIKLENELPVNSQDSEDTKIRTILASLVVVEYIVLGIVLIERYYANIQHYNTINTLTVCNTMALPSIYFCLYIVTDCDASYTNKWALAVQIILSIFIYYVIISTYLGYLDHLT